MIDQDKSMGPIVFQGQRSRSYHELKKKKHVDKIEQMSCINYLAMDPNENMNSIDFKGQRSTIKVTTQYHKKTGRHEELETCGQSALNFAQ